MIKRRHEASVPPHRWPPGEPPVPPLAPVALPLATPDPYSPLFEQRRVFLRGRLDAEAATALAAQLLTLDGLSADPVTLLISSPGGPIDAVWTVLDVLDALRAPVATTGLGAVGGTAAAVLACGTGGRSIAAHATVSLRLDDGSTELWGPAGDLAAAAERVAAHRAQLIERLAIATGLATEAIAAEVDRGGVLTAADACALGLADATLSRPA